MEDLERRYFTQISIDIDESDTLRHELISSYGDKVISDPKETIKSDLHVRWWKLGYYKPIEHYRKLAKVTEI